MLTSTPLGQQCKLCTDNNPQSAQSENDILAGLSGSEAGTSVMKKMSAHFGDHFIH